MEVRHTLGMGGAVEPRGATTEAMHDNQKDSHTDSHTDSHKDTTRTEGRATAYHQTARRPEGRE